MKKSLILGLIATTTVVASSYGQGYIQFNSYTANGSAGIQTTFGNGSGGSGGLTSAFTAGLLYSLTPITDVATTDPTTALAPLNAAWTLAPNTAVFGTSASPTSAGLGYYVGQNFVLPGYSSGTVYFEVIAYQTGQTYSTSTVRGHSASFTETLATGTANVLTMDNMQPFSVYALPVPEPTTLALAGLGGLASLVMLRRKTA